MNDETIIGVIPARGGSHGLPGKNLRDLCGKPLLYYIAKAAKDSKMLDSVYVSTDSETIADVAKANGLQTILHPKELSIDTAATFGVIRNALFYFNQCGLYPSVIVTLRPTSPLCLPEDIDAAIRLLKASPEVDSVFSVNRSPIHPYRILKINELGGIVPYGYTTEKLHPEQRQSFEPVYVRNGAIYASRTETIKAGGMWGKNNLPYIMPSERSVNINEEIDFFLAEALLNKIHKSTHN